MSSNNTQIRRSFVPVEPDCHFPIQNLPYGIASPNGAAPRVVTAIGDRILDLAILADAGLLPVESDILRQDSLNALIGLGRPVWQNLRARLTDLLDSENPTLRDDKNLCDRAFMPMADVRLLMPIRVGGYSDFYASRAHATNVGTMFRGAENALPPNWLHLPIGYNGRASSIVVSGTDVRRPNGQTKAPDAAAPSFGPCRRLDFELEMAAVIGRNTSLGEPLPVGEANDAIFGLVLLNDWSARDIQQWEYQPLGPFNAKTFATSISPWVVTMEALADFCITGPAQDPEPLPYLRQDGGATLIDIALTADMRSGDGAWTRITTTNASNLYWSFAQQIAHHTVSGCNLAVGDLVASGTISGWEPGERGSLLEITWGGRDPVTLADGSGTRTFLQDGDELRMSGWCHGDGYRVGFGEVTGRILPAPAIPG